MVHCCVMRKSVPLKKGSDRLDWTEITSYCWVFKCKAGKYQGGQGHSFFFLTFPKIKVVWVQGKQNPKCGLVPQGGGTETSKTSFHKTSRGKTVLLSKTVFNGVCKNG